MQDAIVISDIHLGSSVCRARPLSDLLKSIESGDLQTRRLIINGDLFDDWDFRKLKKSHWKVLSHIRKISGRSEVVWIRGNHDGPAEVISHLIGVDFLEEYSLESGGVRILFLHGDRFDNFIARRPVLTKLADNIYRMVQRLDRSFYLAKLVKRGSKTFLRCSEKIRDRARQYAGQKGYDAVVCSHVHMEEEDRTGEVWYFNTGCWTDSPCSYLSVASGEVALHRVQ